MEQETMPLKAVAYIDLLGFSSHVKENMDDAVLMLSNFNTALHSKLFSDSVSPVESYSEDLRPIAARGAVDSFEQYIPFSDSLFIVAEDCDRFILQLGSFVYTSFHMVSDRYIHPIDPDDPSKGTMVSFQSDENGELTAVDKIMDYFPTLFRGGIAYGEVIPLNLLTIDQYKSERRSNLMGKAVVDAVSLEGKVKGPRIIFGSDVYEQLSDNTKRYIRATDDCDGCYEILWPALKFIPENRRLDEITSFYETFIPAMNFWKAYNKKRDTGPAEHFFQMMKLTVNAAVQYADLFFGQKDYALGMIRDRLQRWNCGEIESRLMQSW